MKTHVFFKTAALCLALLGTLTGCESNGSRPSAAPPSPCS
ncbi:hypothetical protein A176_001842 [Myxococcus hansupus]|uniref:Lipoprotein n=1 Tax=Pseudomyxococcus hansupus TaxID=1297742 RepID=A0A0H4WUE7_9BACT|nr:hypothetical protein A176_001842 [Myxococcus hansupus]